MILIIGVFDALNEPHTQKNDINDVIPIHDKFCVQNNKIIHVKHVVHSHQPALVRVVFHG